MSSEKRLADVDALLEEVNRTIEIMEQRRDRISVRNVIMCIKNAPTVDAVEVVHGEWSTIEDDYCGLVALHCSVCNQEWWFEEDAPIKHYHYCPNCGAKMDGDSNG